MTFIKKHSKIVTISLIILIASIGLIAATITVNSNNNAKPAAKEKIPEHKCCHNGQCCGTANCCDDKGCKSAKCPAIKGNDKDKDKKS